MKKGKFILVGRKLWIYGIKISTLFALLFFISSCANQQPPGGGEEDRTPPKVSIISPKPNTTNFRGNSIVLEFNEYVDRRSFQDAFRISPYIKGDIEYNWSGTEVEVVFPDNLERLQPDKTFVINISSSLKDIRGNTITSPINLAFSTGSKIDKGFISGVVYNNNNKAALILAYRNPVIGFDPTKNNPDYVTETSTAGVYELTNLAPGMYRVITILDDDKNLLFTSERESYGVLPYDIEVVDSTGSRGTNFYLKNLTAKDTSQSELDYTKYFKDTLGIIYSSVENNSASVLPEQSIFFYFSRGIYSRSDFVEAFKITDENGTAERVVFNWRNDSLVEVFSPNKFASNRRYAVTFSIKTPPNDSLYNYRLGFRTVSANSFGELKGSINSNLADFSIFSNPVRIDLEGKSIVPAVRYKFDVMDSVFSFKNILETEYTLFTYIDMNNNSVYDFGYPYPFEPSEPFYIYPQPINIKGGWTVENVVINFIK